jgi:Holliday junction resolvasome RuvABC endonuclease subunit
MGVDLGVHKLSCAVLEDTASSEPSLLRAESMDIGEGARDLQLCTLASYAHDMALSMDVGMVWIEEVIIGNNRKYSLQLAEMKGAVLASMAHLRMFKGIDTRTVDNKVWKREMLDNGNASKQEIQNYIIETYPRYAPFCGGQDEFDAVVIALYGLRVSSRAESLHL